MRMLPIRILFIVISLFWAASAPAEKSAKEIEDILSNHPQKDSIRVNHLMDLSFYYRYNDNYRALTLAMEALSISRKIKYNYGIVYSLNHEGAVYQQLGQFQNALKCFLEADSMKVNPIPGVQKGVALALNNIGVIYAKRGNKELARNYYEKALTIDQSLFYARGIGRELGNIGKLELESGHVDSAIDFIARSIELDSIGGLIYNKIESLNDLGEAYNLKGQPENAKEALTKSLQLNNGEYKNATAYSYYQLGKVFRSVGQTDNALYYMMQAFNLASEINDKQLVADASAELVIIYKAKKQLDQALHFQDTIIKVSNYLNNQHASSLMDDLQEKYEKQKKQEEIKQLQINEAKMQYYNDRLLNFRNWLFLSLSLSLVMGTIIYKAYRDKRRVNSELMRKFAEVRQMNGEIKHKSLEIEAKNSAILNTNNVLQRQRHQLTEAQRIARLGSWEYNPATQQCSISNQLLELFGLPKTKIYKSFYIFTSRIYPEDRKNVITAIRKVFKENTEVDVEFRLMGSFDDVRFIKAKTVPVINRKNEVVMISGTVLDTTTQKRNEQKLVEAKEQAEFANRSKGAFLANMSHEIRTPLNGILGFTDILLRETHDTQQEEYLRHIRNSGDNLLLLLNDILDFNKIEQGKLEVEKVDFNLHEMVHQAMSPYKIQAAENGLAFELNIAKEVPVFVQGDPHRIRQLLVNYISNALKFTTEGKIRIIVINESDSIFNNEMKIRFVVADSGVGVPLEKQFQIFELFTQADSSTTRKYGGTGLGLAITKQLSNLLGGETGVISPGSLYNNVNHPGSDFWFSVQVYRSQQIEIKKQEFKSTTANIFSTPLNVLVAEDNPINQLLIRKVLENMNCRVTIVENGKLAVDALAENKFDVVLLDIQMPVMDGYQATLMIRQLYGISLPIIGVSANVFKDDIQKSLLVGMNAHIGKPFTAAELFAVLNKYLKQEVFSG